MTDIDPLDHEPESPLLNEARPHIGMDVPKGYADELRARLHRIPLEHPMEDSGKVRFLNHWKTWSLVAAAACLVAAVLILPQEKNTPAPCTTFDCMVEAWASEETAVNDFSESLAQTDAFTEALDALDVEPELFAAIDDTTMVLYLNDGYLSDLELYGLLLNE